MAGGVATVLETPYGRGTVVTVAISVAIADTPPTPNLTATDGVPSSHGILRLSLTDWKLANGSSPTVSLGIPFAHFSAPPPPPLDKEEDQCPHTEKECVAPTKTAAPTNNPPPRIEKQEGICSDYLWSHHKMRTMAAASAHAILDCHSRSLALDVTPYLLYASGPAVSGLLASNVSDYVEFKSLEGLLYMEGAIETKEKERKNAHQEKGSHNRIISSVPCSKNDVFSSKRLSPMDKRRLMKFLQTALDFATAEALIKEQQMDEGDALVSVGTSRGNATTDEDVGGGKGVDEKLQQRNEHHLNQGRSLSRPQNKAVASSDLQLLQELCRSGSDSIFETYLTEHQKLSPSLTALVRYALALDTADLDCHIRSNGETTTATTTETTTATGMKQLSAHMMALGRFGATAFLVPLYGSGELAQAFCRSAAVYGATYLLRRAPTGILIDRERQAVRGIVLNDANVSSEENNGSAATTLEQSTTMYTSKSISCTHVVVPDAALVKPSTTTRHQERPRPRRRVLRRISILSGKPLHLQSSSSDGATQQQQEQQQRHVMILPPGTVSPRQTATIHTVFLDEAVNVVPRIPGGCTMVHFTTTVVMSDIDKDDNDEDNDNDDDDEECETLLKDALDVVLQCCRTQMSHDKSPMIEEIFHASFSYEIGTDTEEVGDTIDDGIRGKINTANDDSRRNAEYSKVENNQPFGWHVIRRCRPGLTADAAFEQAAAFFLKICPQGEFLQLSKEMGDAVKAALGEHALDEEDEEKTVLDSAIADLT